MILAISLSSSRTTAWLRMKKSEKQKLLCLLTPSSPYQSGEKIEELIETKLSWSRLVRMWTPYI